MHSRNPGFVAGDYWMVCSVCGFHYRRSQMKERWDKAWVCEKDFELRHPQDFVRGIKEKIAVPIARPDSVDFTDSTTLTVAGVKGDLTITVASVTGIDDDDSIGVVLDSVELSGSNSVHWTTANGDPAGLVVTLTESLPSGAASGNVVYTPGTSFSEPETTTDNL